HAGHRRPIRGQQAQHAGDLVAPGQMSSDLLVGTTEPAPVVHEPGQQDMRAAVLARHAGQRETLSSCLMALFQRRGSMSFRARTVSGVTGISVARARSPWNSNTTYLAGDPPGLRIPWDSPA